MRLADVWLVDNGDYWKAVWKKPDGARASKSLGAKAKISRRQAKVLCRQLADHLTHKAATAGSAPRLSEWLDRYVALRLDVKDSTRGTYRDCGRYLRCYFDTDPPIDKITRADAAGWVADMGGGKLTDALNEHERRAAAETGRKKPGRTWNVPKLATVRRHVRAAKMMFAEAVDQDLILFNPFDRLTGSPPKVQKNWREVTPDDLQKILDACPGEPWRMLFALCRYAALRRGEALALGWSDVDWDRNRMYVLSELEQETTKQARRVVPIEPARCPTGLTMMLRDALKAVPDGAKLVCGGVGLNNLRRRALAIIRKAGIEQYAKPFHTLRKCRISELAMEYPQGVVEDWCGHDEEVSRRHYQRVPEELYEAPSVQTGHSHPTKHPVATAKRAPTQSRKSRTIPRKSLVRRCPRVYMV